MKHKTTPESLSIARAGGGLRIDSAGRTTSELLSIAKALSGVGSRLYLFNTQSKTAAELLSIARAASERVVFEE
jgi:hypothetical protein